MSLVAVPFYQKRHKHFDQSYRNIQTRYLLDQYASKKRATTQSSSERSLSERSSSQRASSLSSTGGMTCRVCAKRVSAAEEEEAENENRYRSLEATYGEAKRQRFLSELAQLEENVHLARSLARDKLDKYSLEQMVDDKLSWERHSFEDRMSRAPEILVRLRSHTIWERMSVRLCFTVQGFPTPVVQWYKDGSLICQAGEPGKYRIESRYGVHTLEINRANFEDTATYSAVATNPHGQVSTNAAVVVRRYRGDEEPLHSVGLPIGLPLSSVIPYTHFDIQFLEKFGVTFRREGETVTLKCTLLVTPDLKRVQPRAEWYRDDVLLKESKWTKMFFGEGQASLSFSHLNKDDEGLYTLRIMSRGGVSDHSAFLFVRGAAMDGIEAEGGKKPHGRKGQGRDADPLVTGAPGAPMDLQCHDANRDYVIVTWKPPNTTTESPVIGYFIDKCEVGINNWVQCNDAPVKICKYPVTGLFEGRSYVFRVRAVNNAGISRPSRISDAVAALDPVDLKRLQAIHLEGEKEIVIYQDDLEGDVQIPGPPTNVQASEVSRNYVVLSWDPPSPRGKEPLMYFIEKSAVGSGSWQRVNAQTAVRSPRYAVFDLAEGKSYVFRVLSANKHGLSDPSEITPPIQAQDMIVAPSAPGRVLASRNTKTSVVVQWDRPKHEEDLLGYYVDCCVAGTNLWEPCNHKPIGYNRFVVHGLTTGEQYIFRVKAVNAVGTSENSQESEVIKVQAALTVPSHPYGITLLNCDGHSMTLGWKVPKFSGGSTILGYYLDKREVHHKNWHEVNSSPVKERILTLDLVELAGLRFSDFSGPAYDLTFCEVRDTSLVMLWKAPVYSGSSPVSGYFVDFKEEDSGEWKTTSETATPNRYLKVCDLQQGKTYVFRVRAVNTSGPGKPSDTSEPVLVEARPGTKEISAGVDEEGNIYLGFDCQEMTDASQFTWCKAYEEIADEERFEVHTEGDHSKLYFKNPDKVDIGTYSVSVSDTDGVSSSFVLDEEAIPLKSELAYEIFDKGQVRFWLQAEHLSPDASFRFVINDREVSDSETHRIKCDRSTGMIEMVMDRFTIENEGTYTVQIQDGKAKNQSSLVLIGDGASASPLKVLCTPEGIRLQCFMKYFTEEMKVSWYHKESKISSSEHMRIGGSEEMAWLQICEPTEKDKGKYTFEIFDGKDNHQRSLDLSGQDRGKVIGGLPDVVTIMEGKTLNLTCTVFGNPDPEVVWFKNDKDIELSEHFSVKVEQSKYVSLTIQGVTAEDSGKYSINVKNKYGGEKIDVTVSVYKHGEKIPDISPPQQAKPKLIPASTSSE
ncbi:hypothetical protein NN561_005091 [Cricetulus griseus]